MARREVLEVICDRCEKTETQSRDEVCESDEVAITYRGESKTYKDLCRRCRTAVEGYYKRITKQVEDKVDDKPETAAPQIDPPAAAPEKKKGLFGG